MKSLKLIVLLALTLVTLFLMNKAEQASAFIAIVNGEEVESQFYHYGNVYVFDDNGKDELIFRFWFEKSQVGNDGNYANSSFLGQLHIGYDVETNTYFIEEIVDIASQVCDIEGNCWTWEEVQTELTIFGNEIVWLANEHAAIDGETKPIMFDGLQFPEMMQGENLEIVNDYLTDNQNFVESAPYTIFLPIVTK